MVGKKSAEWWTTKTRDFVLFMGGLAGVAYETIVEQVDRPALLALFAGMLGLPVFLARDPAKKDDAAKPPPPGSHKADDDT